WIKLMAQSKPVIVAINGAAVGIGATHVLAADIRIASHSASFAFPFLKRGTLPECGSTALLPRLIGLGRASDLILRGQPVPAEDAMHWGLVTQLHSPAGLLPAALDLASQIAALPAHLVRLAKATLLA